MYDKALISYLLERGYLHLNVGNYKLGFVLCSPVMLITILRMEIQETYLVRRFVIRY